MKTKREFTHEMPMQAQALKVAQTSLSAVSQAPRSRTLSEFQPAWRAEATNPGRFAISNADKNVCATADKNVCATADKHLRATADKKVCAERGCTRAQYLFIANPHARNGRARKKLVQLRSELERRGMKYDLAFCESLGHARALSERANRAGYEVIVGVGGDGTINRVLNGFFNADGHRLSKARLGAIHIGTSPDLCRSYGMPVEVPAAVEALLAGVTRQIRVGKVVYETTAPGTEPGAPATAFFGCCANVGLGASLARLANSGIRKYAGDFLGTFFCLARVLLEYSPRTVQLELDGRSQRLDKVYNLAVGRTHYIASGIKVRHELREGDDRLYVICLRDLSWSRLAPVLWRLYRGRPFASGRCLSLAYAKSIRMEATGTNSEVEFDGDPAGWCPCRIESAPEALDLIVGGGA